MKKTFYILSSVIIGAIGIFLLSTFVLKVNNSGVGKYVPIGDKMILNTTNGKVYVPKRSNIYEDFKWKEFISFSTKKEISSKEKISIIEDEEKIMREVLREEAKQELLRRQKERE